MSDLEPRRHPKKEVLPRHIPQEIVPVPYEEVREFVRDAVKGTGLANPLTQVFAGWIFFEPHLRFTAVDAGHTRIELDMVGLTGATNALLYPQRRAGIHRFFVALEDELARRERWRPQLPERDDSDTSVE